LAIALVPYIGLPLYLLFGTRKLVRAGSRAHHAGKPSADDAAEAWPRQLVTSMGQPAAAAYSDLHVHANGKQALQALWSLIDSAEHELVLCTFILARDRMGKELCARLIAKARAGIKVRLMVDGFGRILSRGANLHKLKAAGVQVALFSPLLHLPFKGATNLRNHRKMALADGMRLWCGGRNFAAEYFEGTPRRKPWADLSFDLAGPLAAQALALFERDWSVSSGSPLAANIEAAPAGAEPMAQLIASGPDQPDDTIHDILVSACFKASRRIVASTPYFVPGDTLLMALSLAARREVVVDLIIPLRSNHRMADFARHRALRALAAAGARIWLTPGMSHAKAVIFDDDLALAGSANLDSRSLFLNYEMMIAFYRQVDIQSFADFVEQQQGTAKRYQPRKPGLLRDFAEGLVLWLAYQL
jgi:cardiolipin synthase